MPPQLWVSLAAPVTNWDHKLMNWHCKSVHYGPVDGLGFTAYKIHAHRVHTFNRHATCCGRASSLLSFCLSFPAILCSTGSMPLEYCATAALHSGWVYRLWCNGLRPAKGLNAAESWSSCCSWADNSRSSCSCRVRRENTYAKVKKNFIKIPVKVQLVNHFINHTFLWRKLTSTLVTLMAMAPFHNSNCFMHKHNHCPQQPKFYIISVGTGFKQIAYTSKRCSVRNNFWNIGWRTVRVW